MIKVIDNFLDEEKFKEIENIILFPNFKWEFSPTANSNSDNENSFQFFHHLVHEGIMMYDSAREILDPIMSEYIRRTKETVGVVRGRVNFFIRTSNEPVKMGYHIDIDDNPDAYSILLYMEDSNGYTHFKDTDEKIYSKRNRVAIFPAVIEHQTVTQTDKLYRRNVNINFVKNVK